MASVIRRLTLAESIPPDELTAAFETVMAGGATGVQIAALLVGLRARGETASDIAAVVRALRKAMIVLSVVDADQLVDTCGTGGGTISTFNISTGAALVAAGAGVRIAKHGNRSFTSKCGSADVLEALGVAINVSVDAMARALNDAGIVFMFAPLMHPAMRHVGPVRAELAVQTVMNIVGPLANPARAGRQVIGVADEKRVAMIAGALRELDTVHALVVHGSGMDEVSPLTETHVIEIHGGATSTWTINPARYGYRNIRAADLAGGPPEENANIILRLLEGGGPAGAAAAVVLNAAAAIFVSGRAESMDDGVEQARSALESGKGMEALDRLRSALPRPVG